MKFLSKNDLVKLLEEGINFCTQRMKMCGITNPPLLNNIELTNDCNVLEELEKGKSVVVSVALLREIVNHLKQSEEKPSVLEDDQFTNKNNAIVIASFHQAFPDPDFQFYMNN